MNEEEFNIIKEHPLIGESILKNIDILKELIPAIKFHHERYNGRGCPDKIGEKKIPVLAPIISIADAYDAITSERSYRKKKNKNSALKEIEANAGKQFDPEIVDAFKRIIARLEVERTTGNVNDPVCFMEVIPETSPASCECLGNKYFFCSLLCKRLFMESPDKYSFDRSEE